MGLDGIPVDTYIKQKDRVDVTTVAMEFGFILTQVRKATASRSVALELSVKAQRLVLICRMISPQILVAIAMRPDANLGKARYMLRTRVPTLLKDLA